MAMVDDTDWLLSHIQHSFITSDDTGMCEMVIQNNDLCSLDEHREKLRRQVENEKQYNQSNTNKNKSNIKIARAPSPDITSGWDFGVRRRSNTAQKLERIRKERQNRVKVKTVHWKQMPEKFVSDHLDTMFEKKDLVQHSLASSDEEELDGFDLTEASVIHHEINDNSISLNPGRTSKKQSLNSADNIPVAHTVVAMFKGFQVSDTVNSPARKEPSIQRVNKKSSTLSKLLELEVHDNPFKEYSKFDGRGHEGTTATQSINMFVYVYGEPAPKFSVCVVILVSGAKIQDLIGLTCFRYYSEKIKPDLKLNNVQGYALHLSEDDGEVDYGLPPLDKSEPVSKFSFPTLALVEKHQATGSKDGDEKFCESVFVKVYDHTGFSLIQVDDLSITMGEILKKAIKRRKGNKFSGTYNLEYFDKPGQVVDKEQTLDSTCVMEFCLVREHSVRSKQNYPTKEDKLLAASKMTVESKQNNNEKTVQYLRLPSIS